MKKKVNYSVFSNKKKSIAIKEGWSFMAGLFTGVWAIYYKMWSIGIPILFLTVAYVAINKVFADGDIHGYMSIVFIVLNILVGFIIPMALFFKGNHWLIKHLKKSLYFRYSGSFPAESKEDAIKIYKNS